MDSIKGGFNSYDAYALMGYQYMAASFDGAGWLPLATYVAEVEATWLPIKKKLKEDPDYFCGQIIFQKDGYNMARRSPVANGLEHQLRILSEYGYRVVTVSELMAVSPFLDVQPDSAVGSAAKLLAEKNWCVAYRDNTIRPEQPLTRGELAMMGYGWKAVSKRIEMMEKRRSPFKDLSYRHPYAAAAAEAVNDDALALLNGRFYCDAPASAADVEMFCARVLGKTPALNGENGMTHGEFLVIAAELAK